MKFFLIASVVLAFVACGKGKDGGGGAGAAPEGGPACSDAAARYAKLEAEGFGNHLAKIKPTPDQVKVVAGKLEAHCTSANWSAANKICVMEAKDGIAMAKSCFKAPKGFGLQVSQVVFDTVKELQVAAPATADGSAK